MINNVKVKLAGHYTNFLIKKADISDVNGYTCQEIRKREGGSNYSAESLRIIVSYVVNSENDAINAEDKIKNYVIKNKNSFLQEGKNEYFYLNEKYFKEFQLDFAKLVLS